jgi:RNA polymerase sigma factor (sigma-70 family)
MAKPPFQPAELPDHPGMEAVIRFLQDLLEHYRLDQTYNARDILDTISQPEAPSVPGTIDEIQIAFLKTSGLEIIEGLDRKRIANRQKFNNAIEALFADHDPASRAFYANISRLLRQFRLNGTYEVRDVIATGFSLGVKSIEAGHLIENPLAWMRTTCLNVIRDLRKKQDKAENPKIDGELWEPGDGVFSSLMVQEDRQALKRAMATLTPEERQILCARFINQWSWKQVSQFLSKDSPLPIGTVRQRGARTIVKLRKAYESVRDSIKLEDATFDLEEFREYHPADEDTN